MALLKGVDRYRRGLLLHLASNVIGMAAPSGILLPQSPRWIADDETSRIRRAICTFAGRPRLKSGRPKLVMTVARCGAARQPFTTPRTSTGRSSAQNCGACRQSADPAVQA